MKINKDWIKLESGELFIDGKLIVIPNYMIIDELGQGANAIVFRAYDIYLKRDVAIKIWNNRGKVRAQEEAIKIAKFKHPLVVETYHFNMVGDCPYSVMELVLGQSGKKWLETPQTLSNRIEVWRLYFEALSVIYKNRENHGDPHLGNVLITQDLRQNVTIKLADAGTSNLRGDKDKLMSRESKIIYETVCKLFPEFDLTLLWAQPKNATHLQTLEFLNSLVDYLKILDDKSAYDWAAHFANKLVDIVFKVPLFDIDEMVRLIEEHIKIGSRFTLYFNRRLINARRDDIKDEYYSITCETRSGYQAMQQIFLKKLGLS
ncbi:protein kinase domain-containing protein [Aeromonas veronii]|uniref:protein kinase domain-containing protein n=1 Tax=Aeromonas veronii TaxID=654 RepID=UPI001117336F|nr:protein kinase [Aeromonas veronii]